MQNDEILLNRFALLMAGSGMPDSEISRLVKLIKSASPSELLEQVNLYKSSLISTSTLKNTEKNISSPALQAQPTLIDNESVRSIERLVVIEAGLPKSVAASIITKSLKARRPGVKIPAFNSKDGFAKWLQQVARLVPLAELLHVAASLRNQRVHSPTDEWLQNLKS